MQSFDGKIVLVTGASSGIGKAAAIMLAQRGAHVIAAARRVAESEATVEAIRQVGGEATFVAMDVSDGDSVAAGFDQIRSRFGRLDAAYNNAGVTNDFKLLGDMTDEDVRSLLEINLYGHIQCMRHELAIMQPQIAPNSAQAPMVAFASAPRTPENTALQAWNNSVAMLPRAATVPKPSKRCPTPIPPPAPLSTPALAPAAMAAGS